jgi:hypothetical protein
VGTARIVTPRVMQVTLRAQQPIFAESQVRRAILGLLDVDLLASVGAGADDTVTQAQAQVRSPVGPRLCADGAPRRSARSRRSGCWPMPHIRCNPSSRRHRRTAAPAPDNNRGRITKDGVPLSLVLGVAANDPTSVAVAITAADHCATSA